MSFGVLLDTGPLVAYLTERDRHHDWALKTFDSLDLPAVSCEPVITEACFLLERNQLPATRVLEYAEEIQLHIGLRLEEEMKAVKELLRRYRNVPMSLADACLVRLAEMTGLPICTLDRDFEIYRTHRGREIELIMPLAGRSLHEP